MIAQPPLQPYIWGFVISCHTVRCILNHKLGKFELSLMLRAANSITSTAIPGRLISVILLHSLLGGFEASLLPGLSSWFGLSLELHKLLWFTLHTMPFCLSWLPIADLVLLYQASYPPTFP